MNVRNKFLLVFISLLSFSLFVWALLISTETYTGAFRNVEFQKNAESLKQLQALFEAGSPEDGLLKGSIRNLHSLQSGASLIEKDAIQVFAFLALVLLAVSLLTLFQESKDPQKPVTAGLPQAVDFEQTLRDLAEARQALSELSEAKQPGKNPAKRLLERQSQPIASVKVQLQRLKHAFEPSIQENKGMASKLLQMSTQAEDNANYAATVRLEWNTLGIRMRQLQEGTEKLMGRATGIQKQSVLSHDLLVKTHELDLKQATHTDKVKGCVHQLYERSKETIEGLQTLIHSMSASNQDVATANRLVRNLSDRAEEIVNIIDVIDDIAEQTNQLALNASIEAARAGEQGQGFAVVAAEVRNLAARSSTATRSITDLLETIQKEAAEASSCLEKTHHSVNSAHGKIVDVNSGYHVSLQLSRQTMDEFHEIAHVSRTFSEEVRSAERLQGEVKRDSGMLLKLLNEQQEANTKAEAESNQLALHADRLSRFLNRQFYDIRHCERTIGGQEQILQGFSLNLDEALLQAGILHKDWEEAYASTLLFQPLERKDSVPIARASSILEYSQKQLELLGQSEIAVVDEADDDMDIRIDRGETLKKAG